MAVIFFVIIIVIIVIITCITTNGYKIGECFFTSSFYFYTYKNFCSSAIYKVIKLGNHFPLSIWFLSDDNVICLHIINFHGGLFWFFVRDKRYFVE